MVNAIAGLTLIGPDESRSRWASMATSGLNQFARTTKRRCGLEEIFMDKMKRLFHVLGN